MGTVSYMIPLQVASLSCWRLLVVAIFVAAMLWKASQAQEHENPVVLSEASGFHRAISDEEMAKFYKQNQNADWLPWSHRKYGIRKLYQLLDTLIKGRPPKYLSLVVIKKNRIVFLPLAARPMGLAISRMRAIVQGLRNSTRRGLVFPDTVYLMNVWDEGRCYRDDDPRLGKFPPCTVPVFSLIKSWNYSSGTSSETDVLLPFFNHVYENLVFYPWEKKINKALMRAAMQAQMRPNCTRLWIIELMKNDPEGRRLLDAGITNNLSRRKDLQLVDFMPIPDHARYKYLLSADGFTASCRLGKLLGTNSVVLKETTPWIEYYYRMSTLIFMIKGIMLLGDFVFTQTQTQTQIQTQTCAHCLRIPPGDCCRTRSLEPNVHFVPFTKDSVLEVVKALEVDPQRCQRIAAEAQQFTYTFLSQHAKAMYVKRALVYYNSLLPDMEAFVQHLVWPQSGGDSGADEEGGGLTLIGVMETMKKFIGVRR
ncbi:hypothetical protein VaNZ11_007608 [Volvox africanus]|uniref:Glycosyl transferase CAP10 domain-containing protein n=1 Tax=Volvox africanus TaxID=51714 RepID=A0ABQ5S3L3_9CHLO|nr:hypothetical protein VaNZ11_007608 [Volvox africanus]